MIRGRKIQQLALDTPRLTLDDLAKACGKSRSSLDKYRSGSYIMPKQARLRLARFIQKHAEQLGVIANALRDS